MDSDRPVRDAVLFTVITLGLSFFVFWGPLALFSVPAISFVSGERGPLWAVILFLVGGFVPSIVGLALTGVMAGRSALVRLLRRVIQFRIGWKNYLGIVLLVGAATAGQLLINRLLGNRFDVGLFLSQLGSLVPLIIIGPLSEEFGWRGYLLDRLQARWNPLSASLLVGVTWGLWHLPLFLMPGTSQHELGIPFVGFLVGVTAVSILVTFFYNRGAGSLVTAVFFHWVYTYSAQVVATGVTRSTSYNWLEYLPYVVAALIFIILFGKRLERRAPQRES